MKILAFIPNPQPEARVEVVGERPYAEMHGDDLGLELSEEDYDPLFAFGCGLSW